METVLVFLQTPAAPAAPAAPEEPQPAEPAAEEADMPPGFLFKVTHQKSQNASRACTRARAGR